MPYERTEEMAHLDTAALKLRSLGFTYQQIADKTGISKTAAYHRVKRALAAIPQEAVEEYRRLEGERLDVLLSIAQNEAFTKKSMWAIDRCLSIMDRRAKLLGLDAPTRHEVITLDAVTAEIQRLERKLGEADDGSRTGRIGEAQEA